jgi:hypothetical protein
MEFLNSGRSKSPPPERGRSARQRRAGVDRAPAACGEARSIPSLTLPFSRGGNAQYRARAQAAAAVPARARFMVKPRRRNFAAISASSAASPPNRCAIPVTSSTMPSGGSGAMKGLQRSDQRMSFNSMAASLPGSCKRETRSGTRARASAKRSPVFSPRARAAALQAVSRRPWAPACTSTSGWLVWIMS